MIAMIIQMKRTVSHLLRQRVHRKSLHANHPVTVYHYHGCAIMITIVVITAMRKIVKIKNAIHGCLPAVMEDAYTIHGDVVCWRDDFVCP